MTLTRSLITGAILAASFLMAPAQAQPRNDRPGYDLRDQGNISPAERRAIARERVERDMRREARRDDRRAMRNTCYRDNRGRTYTVRRDGSRDYARC